MVVSRKAGFRMRASGCTSCSPANFIQIVRRLHRAQRDCQLPMEGWPCLLAWKRVT